MRNLSLFILLLFGVFGYAQNTVVQLTTLVNDDDLGKRLGGATMEILQDGKPFDTKLSATNGKFPIVDLPIGHVYTVYIKKDGLYYLQSRYYDPLTGRFLNADTT